MQEQWDKLREWVEDFQGEVHAEYHIAECPRNKAFMSGQKSVCEEVLRVMDRLSK